MAKGQLFEYAVLYHPKQKKDKEGNDVSGKSVIVKEPTRLLAANDKEVGVLAARSIPEGYLDKLEDVEIVVRPF